NKASSHVHAAEIYSETSESENSKREINTQPETEDPAQKQGPLQFSEPNTNDQRNETSSPVTENYSEMSKSENSIHEINTQPETEDSTQKQVSPEPISNDQRNKTSSSVTENYSETSKSENSILKINTQPETEDSTQKQVPPEPITNDQSADGQHSGDGIISAKEDDNNCNINDKNSTEQLAEVNNIHQTIPNLYQLVQLCLDESTTGRSDSLVNKAIIYPEELEKVCNKLAPGSCRSVSDIQFKQLADVNVQLVGCYGNRETISKLLLQNNVIDKDRYEKFIKGEQTLATGLYLLIIESNMNFQQSQKTTVGVSTKFGFVILWLEKQFYDEKEILTSATNLHRFLTRLTDHQICLMSEEDLRNFSFSVNTASPNRIINIKVKTDQKQEKGVSVGDKFKIKVSDLAICNGDPSKAFIIESNALQSLAITQNISESTTLEETMKFSSLDEFQKFLKKKLDEKRYALSLSDLSANELVLLIEKGLAKPDFLVEYKNKISDLRKQRNEKIDEYKNVVNQWALLLLENYERLFEKKSLNVSSFSVEDNSELKKVYAGHAKVCEDIKASILQIDSEGWKSLKCDFYNKTKKTAWQRWTSSAKSGKEIDKISDTEFIADILVHSASKNVIPKLQEEYQCWKNDENINKKLEECWEPHVQNMTKDENFFKYKEKASNIDKVEAETLKKKLESTYSIGEKMFVKKLQHHQGSDQYEFQYVIEVVKPPLCELRILELPSSYIRKANVNYTNTNLLNACRKILYINARFEIR
ncbi:10675_t:CDS:10, partial [Paraglomus brasilianum]